MLVEGKKLTKVDLISYKNMLEGLKPKHDFLIKYKILNGIKHAIINTEDAVIEDNYIYDVNNYKEKIEFKNIVSLCSKLNKSFK